MLNLIDDIIILSKDSDSHAKNVNTIFKTLQALFKTLAKIKCQLEKCEFTKQKFGLLGFVILEKGIETNPQKVLGIAKHPWRL